MVQCGWNKTIVGCKKFLILDEVNESKCIFLFIPLWHYLDASNGLKIPIPFGL